MISNILQTGNRTYQFKQYTVSLLQMQTPPGKHCFIASQQTNSYKKAIRSTMLIPYQFPSNDLLTNDIIPQINLSTDLLLQLQNLSTLDYCTVLTEIGATF